MGDVKMETLERDEFISFDSDGQRVTVVRGVHPNLFMYKDYSDLSSMQSAVNGI